MELTQKFVKTKRPCADGYRWFIRHRERGSDYQQLLDALVHDGRVEDACWLLAQFGPTDDVLTLDAVEAEGLVFAGSIVVRGGIDVASTVRAGRSITAGAGIRAGRAIAAGEDLRAAAGLHSDGGIAAGGRIRVGWHVDAAEGVHCGEQLRVGWDLRCAELTAGGSVVVGHTLAVRGSAQCALGLRAGEAVEIGENLRTGQGVEAGTDIRCGRHLEAGWGVRAEGDIVAGGAIKAGESLQAGGEIRAGSGYGVYAGLDVPVQAWSASARVRASALPQGLLSGWWDPPPTASLASPAA